MPWFWVWIAVVLSEGLVGPGEVSHGTGGHDKAR